MIYEEKETMGALLPHGGPQVKRVQMLTSKGLAFSECKCRRCLCPAR